MNIFPTTTQFYLTLWLLPPLLPPVGTPCRYGQERPFWRHRARSGVALGRSRKPGLQAPFGAAPPIGFSQGGCRCGGNRARQPAPSERVAFGPSAVAHLPAVAAALRRHLLSRLAALALLATEGTRPVPVMLLVASVYEALPSLV